MAEWVRSPPSRLEKAALLVAQPLTVFLVLAPSLARAYGRLPFWLRSPTLLVTLVVLVVVVYSLIHEMLHLLAAKALGSRAYVKASRLGLHVCFVDPLPLLKAAAVYLAPLLATPFLLPLATLGPACVELWALLCVGDLIVLPFIVAKRPLAVRCPVSGELCIEYLVERS